MSTKKTKLSTIAGFAGGADAEGALGAPGFVKSQDLPIIDEERWMPSQQGGNTYHNEQAGHNSMSELLQVNKNQFGVGMACYNSNQSNRIYHSICPFQVDNNGNITKGSVSSIENSSGTPISTQLHSAGFNNSTNTAIGNGEIAANSGSIVWYGRMYWGGSYYIMSWGGRVENSNTVSNHGRNTWTSSYDSNYPHPNGGEIAKSGGGSGNDPRYHIVGYDTNSYNHWSRWSYNGGNYPNHQTSSQLSSYSSTSAAYNVPQSYDCGWNWASCYRYYYTNDQFGWGVIDQGSSINNFSNNLRDSFPKQTGGGTSWQVVPLRFSEDKVIFANNQSGEYYTWNPSSTSMGQGNGSPKQMDVATKLKFCQSPVPSTFSWSEQPIRTPSLEGSDKILYTSCNWNSGLMVRKYTLDSSDNIGMEYAYANPYVAKPGSLTWGGNGGYGFAGNNQQILVHTTNYGNYVNIATYDLEKMFTSLGID